MAGAQKNRLGNPLINELFIGLTDKDRWNADVPRNDVQYRSYTDNPTFPEILDILFNPGGASAPTSVAPNFFPRSDLTVPIYQGVPTVAALSGYTTQQVFVSSTCGTITSPPLADMLRLNTGIAARARGAQGQFGVLTLDTAGFPNGRRPGDDVVDIYLRLAMGALCVAPFDAALGICNSTVAPLGNVAFTDHSPIDSNSFLAVFPYLNPPSPGNQDRCP